MFLHQHVMFVMTCDASNPCPCGHEGCKCGLVHVFTSEPLISVGSIVICLYILLVLACGLI